MGLGAPGGWLQESSLELGLGSNGWDRVSQTPLPSCVPKLPTEAMRENKWLLF